MVDPTFCQHLYDLLASARLTTGNASGTHVVLSCEMGIPYVRSGPLAEWESRTDGDPDFGTGRRGDHAVNPDRRRLDALLPTDFRDAAIGSALAAEIAALHGCDDADDETVLRQLLFDRYLAASPQAAELIETVRRHPDLLENHGPNR